MKMNNVIIMAMVLAAIGITETSAADGPSPTEAQYAQELQQLVKDGEAKAKLSVSPVEQLKTIPKLPESTETPNVKKRTESSDEVIIGLMDQVEKLKSKVVINRQNTLNLQSPRRSMHVGSKTIYPFIEGKLYEVNAGIDKVTDIALQAGEKLSNPPMAGDTVRWKVGILMSGGREETTHVIVKPLESELETNLIITTDKRIYHIRLLSGDWYMPSVAWEYPAEEKSVEEILAEKRNEEKEEPLSLAPEKLRFDYELDGKSYAWKPQVIFDDGQKTYLKMSEDIAGDEAPALFVLGEESEPMLVNYRVKGRFYIVDRLFEKAELRIGQGKVITITSPLYKKSFFERVF